MRIAAGSHWSLRAAGTQSGSSQQRAPTDRKLKARAPDLTAPAFHIVLVRPEIPQNTGSIARLVAATRTRLHLVGPLGFSLEDRYLKRAGLDYWPLVDLRTYTGWDDFGADRT